jgi:thioesterase domain-containing protein
LINAQVARRLIGHGRSTEALEWLDAATERGGNDQERETLRLAALESLGRKEEAQQQRRLLFERWLDPVMLRAWLKALPDFEDFDAEQEALDFVMRFSDATQALAFLVEWPDMHRADRLVHQRLADLDGKDYGVLRPSAEALEAEYPSAAALLYRRLVESVLDRGSSKYYVYAVRDWHAAGALASRLSAQSIPAHADWVGAVRARHGRKAGFWNAVGAQSQ